MKWRFVLFSILNLAISSGVYASDESKANEVKSSLTLINGTDCRPPGIIPFESAKTPSVLSAPLERTLPDRPPECMAIRGPKESKLVVNRIIGQYFEPACLSKAATKVTLRVDFDRTSPVPNMSVNVLSSEDATDSDLFYCEQAIWESAPFPEGLTGADCEFSKNMDANKSIELKSSDTKFVMLHLIPGAAQMRFPQNLISTTEIESSSNLLKLPSALLKSQRLKEFRLAWKNFFQETHDDDLTKTNLETEALKLRTQFQDLFETPSKS